MKKIIYGQNLSNPSEKNEAALISDQNPPEIQEQIEHYTKIRDDSITPYYKPFFITMYLWGISFIVLFAVIGLYESMTDYYPNSVNIMKSIIYVFATVFVPSFVLFIIIIIKLRRKTKSDEFNDILNKLEKLYNLAYQQLSIPSGAINMDIIKIDYICRHNKAKVKKYQNHPYTVWSDMDDFKIWNSKEIISIPLKSIETVEKIKKKIVFSTWTKETRPNKEEYKKFKISVRSNKYKMKYFYIVRINLHDSYELHIPCYEIDSFIKITGLKLDI